MQQGQVVQFSYDDGFGLIRPDDGKPDVRFMRSEIVGHQTMPRRQRVEFELEHGPKGPIAVNVRKL